MALVAAFAERNIKFYPSKRVVAIDAARKIAALDDNSEMAFDLFLGVPKYRGVGRTLRRNSPVSTRWEMAPILEHPRLVCSPRARPRRWRAR